MKTTQIMKDTPMVKGIREALRMAIEQRDACYQHRFSANMARGVDPLADGLASFWEAARLKAIGDIKVLEAKLLLL